MNFNKSDTVSQAQDAWGGPETKYFFELTPEHILRAVETSGIRCTGRCLTLNSMENRVYEVEVDVEDVSQLKSPSERFRVVKFYRPGRWTKEQILEEHEFLTELVNQEVPVVAPLAFADGSTLQEVPEMGIWFAVFPKSGGRIPDELTDEQTEIVGRLLARVHNVGASHPAKFRISLTPEVYGLQNLKFLLDKKQIPSELEKEYSAIVNDICKTSAPWFKEVPLQRIHGDCHLGNVLWTGDGPKLVDFDDSLMGPCVQDFWLIVPGRDLESKIRMDLLVEAYEQLRTFPRSSLRLIEPLRAFRLIHFSAWIARRWNDPAFKRVFPQFGSLSYWQEQLADLRDQRASFDERHWGF